MNEAFAMKNCIASALSSAFLALATLPAVAQNQAWIRQFGSNSHDFAYAAAPDGSGGVYVAGETDDSLGGPNAGLWDGWLASYDSAGNQTWIRQLGTAAIDGAHSVAPDGSGGVYVSGYTGGSLGGPSAGVWDAWLARYDGAGNQAWISQLGTSSHDYALATAPDGSGGVYLMGGTSGSLGGPHAGSGDAWLARYDSTGRMSWIRQFGTNLGDTAFAAASDGSGGVYVSGVTYGSLGGPNAGGADGWLARYDSAGGQTWIRQLGTSGYDATFAASPDGSGGVYLGGRTDGNLGGPSAGLFDAWLTRYDSAGNQTWIRQLGTSSHDIVWTAAPDGSGGVYVSGNTDGNLGGPSSGSSDAWLARYDSAGNRTWIRQCGSSCGVEARAAAPDGLGGVYVSGITCGSFGGPSSGSADAWLAHYDASCGTSSSYCTAGTTTNGCVPSIAGSGVASASAGSGFTISVHDLEGGQSSLMFYGISGPIAFPWGTSTSFLCVNPPLERMIVQPAGGTLGACDGSLSIDWNQYIATHPSAIGNPFAGGETVWAQAWFRDPPSPKTSNLSNALQFSVCP